MKALKRISFIAILALAAVALPSSANATNSKQKNNDKHWEKTYSKKPCPSEVRSLLTSAGNLNGVNVNLLRAIGLLNKECGTLVNAPATSTPDTTAPVFSTVSSLVATTSVQVSWTTNENTKAKIYFSTTTPVTIADGTPSKNYNEYDVNHTYKFKDLRPLTTYYFKIVATDRAGNITTSNEYAFTTKTSDMNSPVIKSASVSAITANTAKISWTTNESSFGKVIYSTSPSVTSGAGTIVASSTKATSHKVTLTGLSTSTVYYYIITSTDNSGNNATSSLYAFMTQP